MTIQNALQTVKSYCLAHDCESCPLSDFYEGKRRCGLVLQPPIRWAPESVAEEPKRNDIDDSITWIMTEFGVTKEQATTLYHLLHITINSFRE